METALVDVQRLLTQGAADYAGWREIGKLIVRMEQHHLIGLQRAAGPDLDTGISNIFHADHFFWNFDI